MPDAGSTRRAALRYDVGMKILPLFAIALALLACTSNPDDAAPRYSANPPKEIGGERPAAVVLPDDYSPAKKYPLVILLHGYGANAVVQNLLFGLKERVNGRQFILVLPNGTKDSDGKRFWNAGPACCDFDGTHPVDDVGYLTGLIDESEKLYNVDTANVNFMGHSNGGYMSYRLACEIPERIHRLAILAGAVDSDPKLCKSDKPVSLLHMHGTADEIVYYPPHPTAPTDGFLPVVTIGAEATIGRWLVKDGCPSAWPTPTRADFLDTHAGAETEIFTWAGCTGGKEIQFWKMNGGDHVVMDVNQAFRDRALDFVLEP
jgi:polyhydroxybutyrate depolymerase